MLEQKFIDSIVSVASEIKGSPITTEERRLLLEQFNKKTGSAFEKAKSSIDEVIGSIGGERYLTERTASLNNLQNLLAQMSSAANNWSQGKK